MKSVLLIPVFILFVQSVASSQSCTSTFAKTIGSALTTEGGNSLAIDKVNKVIYAAGYANDSTLLIKMNEDGDIIWARTFDVLKKQPERVASVILDLDGMIVISGMTDATIGGKVYLMKYNPDLDQILWVNEYKSHSNDYGYTMIENGPGGNYLMSNNPFSPNDAELLDINKHTGDINPVFSKHYHLGSSQTFMDLVWHGAHLYGVGRFTDGGATSRMRTVHAQLNADDGLPVWIKLGHRPQIFDARLYGSDLVIDQQSIYSTSHGNPNGTAINDDQLFIQKTSLSGQVEWLKHYTIPGMGDVSDELIATGDGFVVMGRNRGPSDIFLLKINHAGDVLWGRTYDFSTDDNTFFNGGAGTQLMEMNDALYFTAYAEEDGRRDLILVKTDREGRLDDSCFSVQTIEVSVTPVTDGIFYDIEPTVFSFQPERIAIEVSPASTSLQTENTCLSGNDIITEINESICMGDVYEGYDQAGTYIDTFPHENGCDSIRILHLRLLNCDPLVVYPLDGCTAYMANGTNMDYTEFVPEYPDVSTCAAVSAGYLFRSPPQENKHSCTPGLNSTPAMCVSALSGCTYQPGHNASVVIEVTLTPEPASIFQFTSLKFYEKAPTTYNWIDGDSGPNNYPTLFGIRILKNGTEIYKNPAVPTATAWNLKTFDFTDDASFEIETPTLFRIELQPYCPVGNGAVVSAWDLEDIVILGGCVRLPAAAPLIGGHVLTTEGKPVHSAGIQISGDAHFGVYASMEVNENGVYHYSGLPPGGSYFLKGLHNRDFLEGVSTLDVLAIQKHLLSKAPFRTLDQYVAADINHDGDVNILDLITLRKTLLGYTPYFPGNTSWRFGVWPQSLESDDPASLKEVAYIEFLQSGTTAIDFLGIKIGDLAKSFLSPLTGEEIKKRSPACKLIMNDVDLKAGVPVTAQFRSSEDLEIEGLQLGLHLEGLILNGVSGGTLGIADEHVSFFDDGHLRLSWTSDRLETLKKGDVLFTLTLIPTHDGQLSEVMHIADDVLISELYTPGETLPVELRHDPFEEVEGGGIGYFSIAPNPFNTFVTLRFLVLKEADVFLDIYDASGKQIYYHKGHWDSGEHTLIITEDDLRQASGMMMVRMVSDGDVEVRKMLRL